MKRFICMLMAMAMTLALTVPAFAQSVSSGEFSDLTAAGANTSRSLAAVTQTPTIKIMIPAADSSTDKLILNPYALPVEQSAIISGGTGTLKDQVISKPLFIGSLSNVPLNVGVKVVASIGPNVVLASKSLAGDTRTTTKSVFLWGQMVEAATGDKVPATPTAFATEYDANEGKTGSMIQIGAAATGSDGVSRTNIYQIPSAASTTDATKATWACMKFFGDAVQTPTEAWVNTDTIALAVTFSFAAAMNG